jgi:hypothetical protein
VAPSSSRPAAACRRTRGWWLACLSLLAGAAQASEPATAGPPHAWPEGRSFTLRIHLDVAARPGDVALIRSGRPEEKICTAPCDAVVEVLPEEEYYFSVAGAPDSSTFRFRPRDGAVDLQVRPGSTAARIAGVAALVAGAVTASIGSVLDFHDNQFAASGLHWGRGLAVQAAGTGISIAGALLIVLNGTSWEVTRRVDAPAPAGPLGSALRRLRDGSASVEFDPTRGALLVGGRF